MDAVRLRLPSPPDLRRSSSCDRDVMRPPRSSSDFTSKKLNADHVMNGHVPPSFICEENVDTHYFEGTDKPTLFSTNHGVSHRKSLKKLGTLPCSKRLKTGHPEHSIKIDEFKDLEGTASQTGSATIQFPCPEKPQMEKKKRRQEGKAADKKKNRASKRSKCDSFVSKAGIFCLDSASGGNNMLGNSPREIRAAEILCEMASRSRTISARTNASEKTKWPKAPSEKTMKARKSTSSSEKIERLHLSADNYDSARSQQIPSIKPKLTSEKNGFTHQNSSGRIPSVHPSPPRCNPVKIASLTPSSTRVDYVSQQKLRRVTLKGSSVGFGGTSYIKDWSSRGRTKRI